MSRDHHDFASDVRPLDEIGERLLKAADIIRERGWCQQDIEAADGRVCVIGAMIIARYGSVVSGSYFGVTGSDDAHRLHAVIGNECAPAWNDYESRTKEQVISALESAAFSQGQTK